ncbi:uncharacterized protein V1510DRAFT_428991 [Dipodascopsis tothii]|uniref:uncharacterized protein n=1 Tax=Dipodascopsis tothii TaxID=44089 RepID=UPI0034CD556F
MARRGLGEPIEPTKSWKRRLARNIQQLSLLIPGSQSSSILNTFAEPGPESSRQYSHGIEIAGNQTSALLQYQLQLDKRRERPNVHERATFVFKATLFGRIYEIVDALLNAAFCVLYVWNTRYAKRQDRYQPLPDLPKQLERVLASLILILYLPRYYLVNDAAKFAVQPFSLVTWLSTLSVLTAAVVEHLPGQYIEMTYMSAGALVFIYPFRFIRLRFAVQETLKPMKLVFIQMSPVARQASMMANTVLCAIFTIAAVLHIVAYKVAIYEGREPTSTYFDAFFFTAVGTVTGIRSTDVPDNRFTKIVNLIVIALGVLWLPPKFTGLIHVINSQSRYDRPYVPPDDGGAYVIISGEPEVSEEQLADFLYEFLHVDHGIMQFINMKATILRQIEPGQVLHDLVRDPGLVTRVSCVKGAVISFTSLNKVSAEKADAAFLLASRQPTDSEEEADAQQMMRALSVRKYNNSIKIFVEVHLRESVPNFDFLAEFVICKDELVDGLISQSLLVPGIASLLVILSTSVSDDTLRELRDNIEDPEYAWMEDYVATLSQEFYTSNFHSSFIGLMFIEAVQIVHKNLGVLVVGYGLDSKDHIRRSTVQISMNPTYVIQGHEVCVVIASDIYQADLVSSFDASNTGFTDFASDHNSEIFTPADAGTAAFVPAGGKKKAKGKSSLIELQQGLQKTNAAGPAVRAAGQPSDGSSLKPPKARLQDQSHSPLKDKAPAGQGRRAETSSAADGRHDSEHFITVQPLVIPVPLKRVNSPVRHFENTAKPYSLASSANSSTASLAVNMSNPGTLSQSQINLNMDYSRGRSQYDLSYQGPASSISQHSTSGLNPQSPQLAHLHDHILICDCSDEPSRNFSVLLQSIRNYRDTNINSKLVVILTRAKVSLAALKHHDANMSPPKNTLEKVICIVGDPTNRDDLERAGVASASRFLVLSDFKKYPHHGSYKGNFSKTITADAKVLLAGLNIESMNQVNDSMMVIECSQRETVKLVGQTRTIACSDEHVKPFLRPSFMSGNTVCPSDVDLLTSQCFYNPFILQIFRTFLINDEGNSQIALEPISAEFHGTTYASLVSRILSSAACSDFGIPIGLRRLIYFKGQPLRYVTVNLPGHTRLRDGDAVYVLRTSS